MIRYYITDRRQTQDLRRNVARVVHEREADWIQVREKDLSARELYSLVYDILQIARPAGVKVFVNERVDVALALGADGVHLPSNAISPEVIRALSPKLQIGVSCHHQDDLAAAQNADFAVLGPIFPPLSKTSGAPAMGLAEFGRLVREYPRLPILALGGITAANAASCVEQGAAGIAAISMFQSSRPKNRTL